MNLYAVMMFPLFVISFTLSPMLFAEDAASIQPEDVCKSAFIAAAEIDLRHQYRGKVTHVNMGDSTIRVSTYVAGEPTLYKARGKVTLKDESKIIDQLKAKAILTYESASYICRIGGLSYEE